MKTLAELKRRLQPGVRLTMTKHSWFPYGALIGVEREIEVVNTQGLYIKHPHTGIESFLDFPKATELTLYLRHPNRFSVSLNPKNPEEVMTYDITD